MNATLPAAVGDVYVRFFFSNGLAAENSFTAYSLWGQSSLELPWTTFLGEMEESAIGNQSAWCVACGNTSTACISNITSTAPSGTAGAAPTHGGLGAVILGFEALLVAIVGLNVVRKEGGGDAFAMDNWKILVIVIKEKFERRLYRFYLRTKFE